MRLLKKAKCNLDYHEISARDNYCGVTFKDIKIESMTLVVHIHYYEDSKKICIYFANVVAFQLDPNTNKVEITRYYGDVDIAIGKGQIFVTEPDNIKFEVTYRKVDDGLEIKIEDISNEDNYVELLLDINNEK